MRAPDWDTRLAEWVRGVEAACPVIWRDSNCGFLVADAAVAMGLPDPAARFRNWTERRLRCLSARGLMAAVPYAEIPVRRARRGDWIALQSEDGLEPGLAVCLGRQALGFDFATGRLARLPLDTALRAFRVE